MTTNAYTAIRAILDAQQAEPNGRLTVDDHAAIVYADGRDPFIYIHINGKVVTLDANGKVHQH